jgi:hypothetical protein
VSESGVREAQFRSRPRATSGKSDRFLEFRDGLGIRPIQNMNLPEPVVSMGEGRLHVQRLLALLDGFIVFLRASENEPDVRIDGQEERIEFPCPIDFVRARSVGPST